MTARIEKMEANQDPNGPVLLINEKDNVAVARLPIAAGTEVVVNGFKASAREDIAPGHKIALKPTPANATISSNLRLISARRIPRIAPLRKIFSRPVSSP